MAAQSREWTVVAMLEWATEYFKKHDVPEARYSIEWLLADVLEMKRLDLYLYYDRPLSQKELDTLRPLFKRRANHEPLQYITGHTDFLNARLTVTPDVLIPRSETEQLVDIVLNNHPDDESIRALDIGTGSGCIAIALKMERPGWELNALDNSGDALSVARTNADENETAINFMQFDILEDDAAALAPCDIIISNPPYVMPEEKDKLEPQVVNYEPGQALFCDDIEKMYKQIIALSDETLKSEGSLYLEIHSRQKHNISSLFDENKWTINHMTDYGGTERFICAKKKE